MIYITYALYTHTHNFALSALCGKFLICTYGKKTYYSSLISVLHFEPNCKVCHHS